MARDHGTLDTSVIPGTTQLVDLIGNVRADHDVQLKDVILVPTPSADLEDPLNWSQRRKRLQMFCIFMYDHRAFCDFYS